MDCELLGRLGSCRLLTGSFVLLAKRGVDVEQNLLPPLGDRRVGDDGVARRAGLGGLEDSGLTYGTRGSGNALAIWLSTSAVGLCNPRSI
jgi:hypothetical protein